jgi:hypothetical protein
VKPEDNPIGTGDTPTPTRLTRDATRAAARAVKLAGLRALLDLLDLLESDAEIPLPRFASRPIAFDVPSTARAERIVAHLVDARDEADRPRCLNLNRAVHGKLGAAEVVVYTRSSSEAAR